MTTHDHRGSPELGKQRLEQLSAAMNQKWGTHVALPLNRAVTARVLRLPFGIFELDWRSGGGLPMNRLTRIWGKPSSLKSTACLRLIRNGQNSCRHCKMPIVVNPKTGEKDCSCPHPRWTMVDHSQFGLLPYEDSLSLQGGNIPTTAKVQKNGIALYTVETKGKDGKKGKIEVQFEESDRCEPFRCLIIDTEHSIDEAWATANGVDTSLLMLVGANWAEQVLDLTEDLIDSHQFDLIILDSLDMLTPGDTLEKALTQTPIIACKANIMARAMQKWTAAIAEGGLLNRYAPTIVIVCQVRAKDIGKPWASLAPSGGWAVGHGISLDIKLEPKHYEYPEKDERALFGTFGFKIPKSKVGGFPQSTGEFRFWLRAGKRPIGDTEDMATVLDHATTLDYVSKVGAKWKVKSPFLPGGALVFKTQRAMVNFLYANTTVYADIRFNVLNRLIGEDASIILPSVKQKAAGDKTKGMKTVEQVHAERAAKQAPKGHIDETDFLDGLDPIDLG